MTELRAIRDAGEYRAALAEIERLMDASPGTAVGDRLDELVSLVEAWEARSFPHPCLDPIDLILAIMDNRGLTRRDLEPSIGSRARVAEVLNRRRALTLPMIRRLHEQLGFPVEPLIRAYDLAPDAKHAAITEEGIREPG